MLEATRIAWYKYIRTGKKNVKKGTYMKRLKSLILKAFAVSLLLAPALPATVMAQDIEGSLCDGANLSFDGSGPGCDDTAGGSVDDVIANVINIFSVVVGVVSVIMIIVGGFQYITSGGDSSKVGNAKNTILYAIIGLVIVAFAQIIVNFVLTQVAEV